MNKTPFLLALDGHDAAGKTTLAKRLAKTLNAAYVRPFSGPQGALMLETAEQGDVEKAFLIAQQAVEQTLKENSNTKVIVCDRLWLTVFTLLPEKYFAQWPFFAPTVLCYSDLPTTLARLAKRDEEAYPTAWHTKYIDLYLRLAQKHHCYILHTDTNNEDTAFKLLYEWAKTQIKITPA